MILVALGLLALRAEGARVLLNKKSDARQEQSRQEQMSLIESVMKDMNSYCSPGDGATSCIWEVPSADVRQTVLTLWDKIASATDSDSLYSQALTKIDEYKVDLQRLNTDETKANSYVSLSADIRAATNTLCGQGNEVTNCVGGLAEEQVNQRGEIDGLKTQYDTWEPVMQGKIDAIENVIKENELPPSQVSAMYDVPGALFDVKELADGTEADITDIKAAAVSANRTILALKKDLIENVLARSTALIQRGNGNYNNLASSLLSKVAASNAENSEAISEELAQTGEAIAGAEDVAGSIASTAEAAETELENDASATTAAIATSYEEDAKEAEADEAAGMASVEADFEAQQGALQGTLSEDNDEAKSTIDDTESRIESMNAALMTSMESSLRAMLDEVGSSDGPIAKVTQTSSDAEAVMRVLTQVLTDIGTAETRIATSLSDHVGELKTERDSFHPEPYVGPTEDELKAQFAVETAKYEGSFEHLKTKMKTDLDALITPYMRGKQRNAEMMDALNNWTSFVYEKMKDKTPPEEYAKTGPGADPETWAAFAARSEQVTGDLNHNLSVVMENMTVQLENTSGEVDKMVEMVESPDGVPAKILANASDAVEEMEDYVKHLTGGFGNKGVWGQIADQMMEDRRTWGRFAARKEHEIEESKHEVQLMKAGIVQKADATVKNADRFETMLQGLEEHREREVKTMRNQIKRNFSYFTHNVKESAIDMSTELSDALRRHMEYYRHLFDGDYGQIRELEGQEGTVSEELFGNLSAIMEKKPDTSSTYNYSRSVLNSIALQLQQLEVPSITNEIGNATEDLDNLITGLKTTALGALQERAKNWTAELAEKERGSLAAVAAVAAGSIEDDGSMGRTLANLLGIEETEKVNLEAGVKHLDEEHKMRLLALMHKLGMVEHDMDDLAGMSKTEREALLADISDKFGGLKNVAHVLSGQLMRRLNPALEALQKASKRSVHDAEESTELDFSTLANALRGSEMQILSSLTGITDKVAIEKDKMAHNAKRRAAMFAHVKSALVGGVNGSKGMALEIKEADKLSNHAADVFNQVRAIYESMKQGFDNFEQYEFVDALAKVTVAAETDKANLEQRFKINATKEEAEVLGFKGEVQSDKNQFDSDMGFLQDKWDGLKKDYTTLETKMKIHGIDLTKNVDLLTPRQDALLNQYRNEREQVVKGLVESTNTLFKADKEGLEVTSKAAEKARQQIHNTSALTRNISQTEVVKTLQKLKDADQRVVQVRDDFRALNTWATSWSEQKKLWRGEVANGFQAFDQEFHHEYESIDRAMAALRGELAEYDAAAALRAQQEVANENATLFTDTQMASSTAFPTEVPYVYDENMTWGDTNMTLNFSSLGVDEQQWWAGVAETVHDMGADLSGALASEHSATHMLQKMADDYQAQQASNVAADLHDATSKAHYKACLIQAYLNHPVQNELHLISNVGQCVAARSSVEISSFLESSRVAMQGRSRPADGPNQIVVDLLLKNHTLLTGSSVRKLLAAGVPQPDLHAALIERHRGIAETMHKLQAVGA